MAMSEGEGTLHRLAELQQRCREDDKGGLALPATPEHDDHPALCRWLSEVFNLDPAHPVTGVARHGRHGAEGTILVTRASAEPITFAPASKVNNPAKLVEVLNWDTLASDGKVRNFKAPHCREVAYALRSLCGTAETVTEAQLAEAILGDYLAIAEEVTGHTIRGTGPQRFEALGALARERDEFSNRPVGAPRYLVDGDDLVIPVGGLQEVARRHEGASLARGYLDGLMGGFGWQRIKLSAHEHPRPNRGRHRHLDAFRGRFDGGEG